MTEAGALFRQSARRWTELAEAALPGALPEMQQVQARLDELAVIAKAAPPLSEGEAADVRVAMREHLLGIAELEEHAVRLLAQV